MINGTSSHTQICFESELGLMSWSLDWLLTWLGLSCPRKHWGHGDQLSLSRGLGTPQPVMINYLLSGYLSSPFRTCHKDTFDIIPTLKPTCKNFTMYISQYVQTYEKETYLTRLVH